MYFISNPLPQAIKVYKLMTIVQNVSSKIVVHKGQNQAVCTKHVLEYRLRSID